MSDCPPGRTPRPLSHRIVVGQGPRVHLGISTCPNDTFAFAALLEDRVDTGGMQWDIELLDIERLNERLLAGEFDVAKTSFHAAILLADTMRVLPVGAALGFGVGPLLLAARADSTPCDDSQLALCPGRHTTASLLFNLFYPRTARVEQVVFSQIMPRLADRSADFGVCIHEGRFTYADAGLHQVADLGERWEAETGAPLPLGGLVVREAAGPSPPGGDNEDDRPTRREDAPPAGGIVEVIDRSLAAGRADPGSALPAMRRYAAELDDGVLMKHVDLYVNDWTVDLGEVGGRALATLAAKATAAGILPRSSTLRVVER